MKQDSETKYDKLVRISLYISIWFLSCILLWTYISKHTAHVEYNKLITRMNTRKLEDQINILVKKSKLYAETANAPKLMDTNTITSSPMTGIVKLKKDFYIELLKTIELYEKCNYIRLNAMGAPFPYTEVAISCILLIILVGVIGISNLANNPFDKMNISEKKQEIQELIDNELTNTNAQKGGNPNRITQSVTLPISAMPMNRRPYKDPVTQQKLQVQYDELTSLDTMISSRIALLKSDSTFNHMSVSFSILIFSFFIGYKMLINSINFKQNLYSGRMFMKSRCY